MFLWSGTDAHMCTVYTCTQVHVHGYRYTCRHVHVQRIVNDFSMAAILLFGCQLLFNLIAQISILDFL